MFHCTLWHLEDIHDSNRSANVFRFIKPRCKKRWLCDLASSVKSCFFFSFFSFFSCFFFLFHFHFFIFLFFPLFAFSFYFLPWNLLMIWKNHSCWKLGQGSLLIQAKSFLIMWKKWNRKRKRVMGKLVMGCMSEWTRQGSRGAEKL